MVIRRKHKLRFFLALSTCLAAPLAGCTVGPQYQPPQAKAPPRWSELPAGAVSTQPACDSTPTTMPCDDLSQWWRTLADPQLDQLIRRALSANLDLRVAEARVREARAQVAIIAGGLLPTLGASAAYSRQQPSENGVQGRMLGGAAALLGGGRDLGFEDYTVGFSASWELDLFGGTRRNVEAAQAAADATIEEHRGVMVMLIADVARNYVELRGAQRRLANAQDNLASQRATLELVHAKRAAGAVTQLDVTRAAAQVAISEARIPVFARQIRMSIHALAVLLTEDVDPLNAELSAPQPVPPTPAEVPVGLPVDIVRRRPDIRRAERELAAATARIGAATAELYPRLSLSGTLGMDSTKFTDLTDWDSHTFGFGPSVRWPIFEGGRIHANIEVQNTRQAQALARYERVVIGAVREVEDALVAYATEQVRRRALADSVAAGTEAVELAQLAYDQGATDLLAVLDAQRTLYAAQDSLAEADQNVSTSLIFLYKALGGGWEVPASNAAGR